MIYSPEIFSFPQFFEKHWLDIKKEYNNLNNGLLKEWPEKKLYNQGWDAFPIYDFPHGNPIQNSISCCPIVSQLVERFVPNHGVVGFSILNSGTILEPHQGYQGNFLRYHLGIDIPQGDCGININGENYQWKNGQSVIFDDRTEHFAWNKTKSSRVVLLLDFIP